jgi:hypothetical protein
MASTTRTTIRVTSRARRKFWKDVAGISMAISVVGMFAMLGYSAHMNNRRAVYELMHESELCHARHHRLACLSIDDELRQRSERYF